MVHRKKICLVTGGAGFIGSHLVEGLVEAGYSVRILDNFQTGCYQNLERVRQRVSIIKGDIRDRATAMKACKGVHAIFHHAALTSVSQSMINPGETHDVNVNGFVNVLEAARQQGVERIFFASSAAVYGHNRLQPLTEDVVLRPVSPYGLSKMICEQYAEMYARSYGMKITCFRYFNVYGPRQNPHSQYAGVISVFVDNLLREVAPTVYGDGLQSRDFVSIHDITRINLSALKRNDIGFGIYNVASGQVCNINELLEKLRGITGQNFKILYRKSRRGDIRHSRANIDKMIYELGYKPGKPLDDGLREYWQSLENPSVKPVMLSS